MGQKGKNVKYVRAYLEEGEEAKEIGVRDGVRLREIETDFGCKGCSQNAAFQVRILLLLLFPLSCRVPAVRHGHTAGKNCRVRALRT